MRRQIRKRRTSRGLDPALARQVADQSMAHDALATHVRTGPDGEPALEQRAAAGDQEAFDLLCDRYFARMPWYFTIFSRREAKAAVGKVMRRSRKRRPRDPVPQE